MRYIRTYLYFCLPFYYSTTAAAAVAAIVAAAAAATTTTKHRERIQNESMYSSSLL